MQEIRVVLNRLDGESTFRDGVLQESKDVRVAFYKVKEEINRAFDPTLYDLRCEISGHIDERAVAMGIRGLEPGSTGLLQVGDVSKGVQYKFVAQLILAVVLRETPPAAQLKKLDEIFASPGNLISVLKLIDDLVRAYVSARQLHLG